MPPPSIPRCTLPLLTECNWLLAGEYVAPQVWGSVLGILAVGLAALYFHVTRYGSSLSSSDASSKRFGGSAAGARRLLRTFARLRLAVATGIHVANTRPSLANLFALVFLADAAVLSVVLAVAALLPTGGYPKADLPPRPQDYIHAALAAGTLGLYLIGCAIAAGEPGRFVRTFATKVRSGEISGLTPLDLLDLERDLGRIRTHPAARAPTLTPIRAQENVSVSHLSGGRSCHRCPNRPSEERAFEYQLFLLCKRRGVIDTFQRERREHAARCVHLSQSVPFLRMLRLLSSQGPTVTALDIAAVLNSLVLYACAVGLPVCSILLAVSVHAVVPLSASPRLLSCIICNSLCCGLALMSICVDAPRRLLTHYARPVGGDISGGGIASAASADAAARYVDAVAERALLDARARARTAAAREAAAASENRKQQQHEAKWPPAAVEVAAGTPAEGGNEAQLQEIEKLLQSIDKEIDADAAEMKQQLKSFEELQVAAETSLRAGTPGAAPEEAAVADREEESGSGGGGSGAAAASGSAREHEVQSTLQLGPDTGSEIVTAPTTTPAAAPNPATNEAVEQEHAILACIFELKEEQVYALQRQMWTDMQPAKPVGGAGAVSSSTDGGTRAPRRRSVNSPFECPPLPTCETLPNPYASTL